MCWQCVCMVLMVVSGVVFKCTVCGGVEDGGDDGGGGVCVGRAYGVFVVVGIGDGDVMVVMIVWCGDVFFS